MQRMTTKDGEQGLDGLSNDRNPLLASSSPLEPHTSMPLYDIGPLRSYWNTFTPARRQPAPLDVPDISPESTAIPELDSVSNIWRDRFAEDTNQELNLLLQNPRHGVDRDINKQASSFWTVPSSPVVLFTHQAPHHQTSKQNFGSGTDNRSYSAEACRHEGQLDGIPGVRTSDQTYMSPEWPVSTPRSMSESITADWSRTAVPTSPILPQYDANISTSNLHGSGNGIWSFPCTECQNLNNQYQAVLYNSQDDWEAHAWAVHESQMLSWEARQYPWDRSPIGVTYDSSSSWLDHIVSVHQQEPATATAQPKENAIVIHQDEENDEDVEDGMAEITSEEDVKVTKVKKTVYCYYPECEGSKAFGTVSDMERHVNQVHKDSETCQERHCRHRKANLIRADKRNKHYEKYHGPFVCLSPACSRGLIDGINYGYSTPALLEEHVQKVHCSTKRRTACRRTRRQPRRSNS